MSLATDGDTGTKFLLRFYLNMGSGMLIGLGVGLLALAGVFALLFWLATRPDNVEMPGGETIFGQQSEQEPPSPSKAGKQH